MDKINKRFVHFEHYEDFVTADKAGQLLNDSIVFIKDVLKIWTHGQIYDCLTLSDATSELSGLLSKEDKAALDLAILDLNTTKTDLENHIKDTNNPHKVTAELVGAIPKNALKVKMEYTSDTSNMGICPQPGSSIGIYNDDYLTFLPILRCLSKNDRGIFQLICLDEHGPYLLLQLLPPADGALGGIKESSDNYSDIAKQAPVKAGYVVDSISGEMNIVVPAASSTSAGVMRIGTNGNAVTSNYLAPYMTVNNGALSIRIPKVQNTLTGDDSGLFPKAFYNTLTDYHNWLNSSILETKYNEVLTKIAPVIHILIGSGQASAANFTVTSLGTTFSKTLWDTYKRCIVVFRRNTPSSSANYTIGSTNINVIGASTTSKVLTISLNGGGHVYLAVAQSDTSTFLYPIAI